MKKNLLLFCSASIFFIACQSQSATSATLDKKDAQTSGIAVVELFTSQGCSSCPPADALLSKEIAAYNKAGKKLIALSFHVDYWNRLGWTDPFSQHQFTQRQYGYSAKLKGEGVYTPQAVVNGQYALVGSKQAQLEDYIKKSIEEKPAATLTILSVELKGKNMAITYLYNGPKADLNIALVQHEATTQIKAGENDGRTLTNTNVVRSWKTMEAAGSTKVVEIEIPDGYGAADYAVILFAQEKGYGKTLAADMK